MFHQTQHESTKPTIQHFISNNNNKNKNKIAKTNCLPRTETYTFAGNGSPKFADPLLLYSIEEEQRRDREMSSTLCSTQAKARIYIYSI